MTADNDDLGAVPKRLVGFCEGSGPWAPDVIGHLIGEFDDGWAEVASHISSNDSWAAVDIEGHALRDFAGISFEWAGEVSGSDMAERFPPAPHSPTDGSATA